MSEAKKFDQEKLKMSLVHLPSLRAMMGVLKHGAEKYGVRNYMKDGGLSEDRLTDAMFRHLMAHCEGEYLDPESGLPHMAHVMTGTMMVMELREMRAANPKGYFKFNPERIPDIFKPSPGPDLIRSAYELAQEEGN